jgi:hypothetical protein
MPTHDIATSARSGLFQSSDRKRRAASLPKPASRNVGVFFGLLARPIVGYIELASLIVVKSKHLFGASARALACEQAGNGVGYY